MSFEYLIEKIASAEIESDPFAHIHIRDFFSEEHWAQVTSAPEIALRAAASDEQLFDMLLESGWKIIDFPGCIVDQRTYMDWHKDKSPKQTLNNSACEGFGVTLRLATLSSPVLAELVGFMATDRFHRALAARFDIDMDEVVYDGGLQKYLDGYEISPHADIRRKAITYMVNVNPGTSSEEQEHHTHYLKLKDEYQYVEAYWEAHPELQRCWVPWSWCNTRKVQRENNSMVLFSPSNRTMHGVKANYNHLEYQRTQLYGNLWYRENPRLPMPRWEDLVIPPSPDTPSTRCDLEAGGR